MRLIITKASQFKVKQNLLWIGTTTFVTVLFWITYSVYVAYSQSQSNPDVKKLLTPLNPTLDEETLSLFEERYQPPEDYTILVYQGEKDSLRVVPLGTDPNDIPASPAASIQSESRSDLPSSPSARRR